MRRHFVESVLDALIDEGAIAPSSSMLAVCAGRSERDVLSSRGFSDVVISNLDDRIEGDEIAPYEWSRQDAQNLTFRDAQFDWGFVADGLHHCSSPHQAVLELYRVSRIGIIVIETRDNLLLRAARRVGLSPDYEVEAVVGNQCRFGGVNNTEVPNFIYRWREDEFQKTIRSFDPVGRHEFRYFYGVDLPRYQSRRWRNPVKRGFVKVVDPVVRAFTHVVRKQGNLLAMVARKPNVPTDLWPWLRVEEGDVVFDPDYARAHYRSVAD